MLLLVLKLLYSITSLLTLLQRAFLKGCDAPLAFIMNLLRGHFHTSSVPLATCGVSHLLKTFACVRLPAKFVCKVKSTSTSFLRLFVFFLSSLTFSPLLSLFFGLFFFCFFFVFQLTGTCIITLCDSQSQIQVIQGRNTQYSSTPSSFPAPQRFCRV